VKIALPLFAALIVAGCNSSAPTPSGDKASAKPSSGAAPSQVSDAAIPASLKNDAYDYYGLASEKPHTFKVTQDGKAQDDQTMTVALKSIGKDEATYDYVTEGGPNGALTVTWSLRPTGLYDMALTPGELVSKQILECPAKLTKGFTWKPREVIKSNGSTISVQTNYNVAGPEKIATPAGPFETIRVDATGSGTTGSTPISLTASAWYSKGVGLVKQKETTKIGNKATTSVQVLKK
jgi:hypothetical protein